MGRPINSRYLGPVGQGDFPKFTPTVKVGTNPVSQGIILRQRTETKFKVNDSTNGTGNETICELVNKNTPDDNEMVLQGTINNSGDTVNIRKLHNRTVIDFGDNRYDWELQDDSTGNVLVLFEI